MCSLLSNTVKIKFGTVVAGKGGPISSFFFVAHSKINHGGLKNSHLKTTNFQVNFF
jgi:hypothetical protein